MTSACAFVRDVSILANTTLSLGPNTEGVGSRFISEIVFNSY